MYKKENYISIVKQLDETTERLELLLNALPVGIVIIDSKTHYIIDANPQALIYFGCPLDDLIGKKCTGFICPNDAWECLIIDQKSNINKAEREIITWDGKKMPVLKTVIKTEIDGNEYFIECFTDISDKKKIEKEQIKKEKIKAILEISGAICHEFNQPLQVVSGYCELLKENSSLDVETKNAINIMSEAIKKMGSLTRNLMNITQYKTKPYLKTEIVDITASSEEK